MKRILMNVLGLVLIAGALTTTSCKKGDEGPAGPKGDSAIANVYYSDWKDVTFDANATATIVAPKVTQNILDQGDVRVYWNFGSKTNPYIVSLPSNLVYNATTTFIVVPNFYVGNIELTANYTGLSSGTNTAGEKAGQFRYVIIPGGVKVARTAGGSSIDWNDYKQVQAYLGLKD
jgi:hypothetical protein